MKRFLAILVGAILAASLTVSAVLAAIPDGGGVIHGCYSGNGAKAKGGTTLNILDTASNVCSNGQTAIAWNQTGPQGPQGPQGIIGPDGPEGPEGAQGPAGPSDGYAVSDSGNPTNFATPNDAIPVSLTLPAGSYLIDAKVTIGNRGDDANGEFLCTLRHGLTGNIVIDTSGARLFGGAPFAPGSTATIPFSGSLEIEGSDTVNLLCATTSSDAFVQWAQITAIKVATLTTD